MRPEAEALEDEWRLLGSRFFLWIFGKRRFLRSKQDKMKIERFGILLKFQMVRVISLITVFDKEGR